MPPTDGLTLTQTDLARMARRVLQNLTARADLQRLQWRDCSGALVRADTLSAKALRRAARSLRHMAPSSRLQPVVLPEETLPPGVVLACYATLLDGLAALGQAEEG